MVEVTAEQLLYELLYPAKAYKYSELSGMMTEQLARFSHMPGRGYHRLE